MGFSAESKRVGDDRYTVSFGGDLDLTTASRAKRLLFELVAAGARTVDIDLSTATVDPTGVGVLIITDNALRQAGGRLRIVGGADDHQVLVRLVSGTGDLGGRSGSHSNST
jgi:anti-anti-sigma regulatory factor